MHFSYHVMNILDIQGFLPVEQIKFVSLIFEWTWPATTCYWTSGAM